MMRSYDMLRSYDSITSSPSPPLICLCSDRPGSHLPIWKQQWAAKQTADGKFDGYADKVMDDVKASEPIEIHGTSGTVPTPSNISLDLVTFRSTDTCVWSR